MHVYSIKTGPNEFIIRGIKTIQNYTRQNNVNYYRVGKTGCFGIPKGWEITWDLYQEYSRWFLKIRGCWFLKAAATSLESYPTLCDPIDSSPPGSPAPGILQARTLEWVAISFSNAWKWKVKVKSLSHVWLFETPWTAAHQAPLPMGFSKQEY